LSGPIFAVITRAESENVRVHLISNTGERIFFQVRLILYIAGFSCDIISNIFRGWFFAQMPRKEGLIYQRKSGEMLNLAAELERSVANGPGVRYVIWVQGCPIVCPGCINQEFQDTSKKKLVRVSELAERILSVRGIEGVTYTGGEPMAQAGPLYFLSRLLKENGLTIVCYTGFSLDELQYHQDPYVGMLLNQLDILIDGRYERENKANLLWRGSTNQIVHFFSDTYARYKPLVDTSPAEMEVVVGEDSVVFTGTLQEEVIRRIQGIWMKPRSNQDE
jgi:anaerobic ribonucleoside-triphosphate reductase activating protein